MSLPGAEPPVIPEEQPQAKAAAAVCLAHSCGVTPGAIRAAFTEGGVLCQEAVCGLRSQCPREPANKAAAGPTPGALETCLRVTLAANPPALLLWLLPAVPGWWVEHSSEAGKPHPDHRGSVPLSVGPSASSKSRQSLQTQPCPQCPHHRFVHPHNQTRKTHRPAPRGASAEEGTVTGPSYK